MRMREEQSVCKVSCLKLQTFVTDWLKTLLRQSKNKIFYERDFLCCLQSMFSQRADVWHSFVDCKLIIGGFILVSLWLQRMYLVSIRDVVVVCSWYCVGGGKRKTPAVIIPVWTFSLYYYRVEKSGTAVSQSILWTSIRQIDPSIVKIVAFAMLNC